MSTGRRKWASAPASRACLSTERVRERLNEMSTRTFVETAKLVEDGQSAVFFRPVGVDVEKDRHHARFASPAGEV